jgi:hypothetical protein
MFSARQLLLPETDFIRLSFITSAIYAFACVLTGVMWWEWVITGGGNANFVFGVRFECISLDPCFAHRETRLQLCHISRQLVSNPIPDRSCRFVYTPGHWHSSSSADTSLQARFAADAAGASQVAAKLQKIKNNQREERARRLTEVSGCTIKAFITRGLSINIRVWSSDSVVVAQEAARAISFRADHALNDWMSLMSFDEEPMKLSRACQHERRMFRSNKERNKICGRTQ